MKRFWSKVDKSAGEAECWPWTASINKDGYGKFKIDGSVQNASRVAWELHNGERLLDRVARHTCDDPSCCNPAHLVAGSQKQNMIDMARRGRTNNYRQRGSMNPSAKLTAAQVRKIKRDIRQGLTNREIAKSLPVTDSAISLIRRQKSWVGGGS